MRTTLKLSKVAKVWFGSPRVVAGAPKTIHKTRGDGNCYFRAISYCVAGSDKFHQEIRDQVVGHMSGSLSGKLQDYMNVNIVHVHESK